MQGSIMSACPLKFAFRASGLHILVKGKFNPPAISYGIHTNGAFPNANKGADFNSTSPGCRRAHACNIGLKWETTFNKYNCGRGNIVKQQWISSKPVTDAIANRLGLFSYKCTKGVEEAGHILVGEICK
jgi:hypothetical protein